MGWGTGTKITLAGFAMMIPQGMVLYYGLSSEDPRMHENPRKKYERRWHEMNKGRAEQDARRAEELRQAAACEAAEA